VAQQTSLDQLIFGLEQVRFGNRVLRVWALHHNADLQKQYPFVILDDITEESRSLEQHQDKLAFYILLTISIFGALVIAFAMRPINKIKKLTAQYPNIALHRFEEAKKALPQERRIFEDEIDVLRSETYELIQQLQSLYLDLDHKNRVLEHKAMHDELTGVGNRNRLNYELDKVIEQAKEQQSRWALVAMDLDNFKHINDTLGHLAGDQLLKIIAARLNETVRPEDTVCRLGGDEFVIILDEIRSRDDINAIMNKLFTAMQQPINIGQRKINIKTSAGVYTINTPDTDPILSLKSADLALYAAKESGKNCYRIFDEDMSRTAEKNFIIENDFERSLIEGEFYLVYQPQISSKTGELTGFEALVRWNHRDTDLYPNMFIPILEESDKILQLGAWVMEQAIKDLAKLLKKIPTLKMSVNLSAKQIFDPTLVKQMTSLCKQYGIEHKQLEVEITETVLISDVLYAKNVLDKMRELGFLVAIDDFGTGYSSLSYISQLSFDSIKLDRSFIRHLTYSSAEQDMLSAVIYMTKRMSSEVVAEGVEDEEHFKILQELDCDVLQGFLIQRPDTLSNLEATIDNYISIGAWPTILSLVSHSSEELIE
jgi:diguanylate cyclase (GGDEF)-like protein